MIGQVVNGYKILRKLGEGGMATVYYAENSLGNPIALKVLNEKFTNNSNIQRRFKQEANIMMKLGKIDGICHLIGCANLKEQPVILMEYLDGTTLKDYIEKHGPIKDYNLIRSICYQLLTALNEAHQCNIIHRDIKPSNLILTSKGDVKILDFGISKLLYENDKELTEAETETNQRLGTLSYMSPEQIRCSEQIDARTDIYSFGLTLYYLLTSEDPLTMEEESLSEILDVQIASAIRHATRKYQDKRTPDCKSFFREIMGQKEARNTSSKIIGIDFGNSYTRISVFEGNKAVLIDEIPSVICFNENSYTIGKSKGQHAILNPENTICSIKSLIGKKWSEIHKETAVLPYKLIKNNEYTFYIDIHENLYSSHALVSVFFLHLKNIAEEYLGNPIDSAIITVPAHFSQESITFLSEVAEIVGIKIERFICDTVVTALTIPCMKDEKEDKRVAIVDIGSSGMSISIVELGGGVYEVLSTSGNAIVSGNNIDQLIISWLLEEFREEEGVELQLNQETTQRLKEAAEKAKIELSNSVFADINLPYIMCTGNGYKHLIRRLTIEKFEKLISPLVKSAISICFESLAESKIDSRNDLEELILIGGTSCIPIIRKSLESYFNKSCSKGLKMEKWAAMGAAMLGACFTYELKGIVILDVISFPIGIEVSGGVTRNFIERNTTIPCRKSETFTTSTNNQTEVSIHILKGDSFMASNNQSLGVFHYYSDEVITKIEVYIDIDANKRITIDVKDKARSKIHKFWVQSPPTISKHELMSLKIGIQNFIDKKDIKLLSKKKDEFEYTDIEPDNHVALENLPVLDE